MQMSGHSSSYSYHQQQSSSSSRSNHFATQNGTSSYHSNNNNNSQHRSAAYSKRGNSDTVESFIEKTSFIEKILCMKIRTINHLITFCLNKKRAFEKNSTIFNISLKEIQHLGIKTRTMVRLVKISMILDL